MEKRFIIQKY